MSVTFPTRAMNVPGMALMAVTLKQNPSLFRVNAPQVAIRNAYREAHRLLSEAADPSKSESERRTAIQRAFGKKALEFFLVNGKLHQPTIDEILRALETDGTRMVPLALNWTAPPSRITTTCCASTSAGTTTYCGEPRTWRCPINTPPSPEFGDATHDDQSVDIG